MTSYGFIKVIASIITILIGLTASFIWPWIKTKMNAEELAILCSYIRLAVRCAEQIFNASQNAEKKEYVLATVSAYIKENLSIDVSAEQLDALIEGTVNEIKHADDYVKGK